MFNYKCFDTMCLSLVLVLVLSCDVREAFNILFCCAIHLADLSNSLNYALHYNINAKWQSQRGKSTITSQSNGAVITSYPFKNT